MKSFTAKEFSRCPAKVYEAAREDGSVEIAHDRFGGTFQIYHVQRPCDIIEQPQVGDKVWVRIRCSDTITGKECDETTNGLELARLAYQARKRLVDDGLVPPDQLTENEKDYLKNKKASD